MKGRQLDLFATEPTLDFSSERRLAARVPAHVRFGTSSWTFPGWGGIVYPGQPTERELVRDGLSLYAKYPLFTTVGIDRSYYRPLEERDLARYAAQLPPGFRCVSKVWNEITSIVVPRTQEPNPSFLDVDVFRDQVLAPIEREFRDHAGPIVFEFPPSTGSALGSDRFASRLDGFLAKLPPGFDYAVELRNTELLTTRHLDVLSSHGVGHVLNYWEAMPEIGVQLDLPGVLAAPFVVSRLLIPPGHRYEKRRESLAPFDRILDPREEMRADVARLVDACASLGKVLYIIANNKAEGSSPLTIRALAERVAATDAS